MDVVKEANIALKECDARLRKLAEDALEESDYEAVIFLTNLLRDISALRPTVFEEASSTSEPVQIGSSAPARRRPATSARKAVGRYPRFRREGDYLIKTGWSKKAGTEYEHRAPIEAVLGVGEELADQMANGRVSRVDELPSIAAHDAASVPSYQVYLAVAWLRHEGLISRVGRKGYTSPSPQELRVRAELRWGEMGNE